MTQLEYQRRLRRRTAPLSADEQKRIIGPVREGQQVVGVRVVAIREGSATPQEKVFASDVGLTRHQGIWRPLCGTGEIHALPGSRGRAIATNGVLIAIDVGREELFIGHASSWIADDDKDEKALEKAGVKTRKQNKTAKLLADLIV